MDELAMFVTRRGYFFFSLYLYLSLSLEIASQTAASRDVRVVWFID